MVRLSSAIIATVAFVAASSAQQCNGSEAQCANENDNMLLRCDGTTWATSQCASDQYCMTMIPGSVNCMLRPDGRALDQNTPTATSASRSSTTALSRTSESESESEFESSSETSKGSGAAANKAAAIGLGVVAVALVALF